MSIDSNDRAFLDRRFAEVLEALRAAREFPADTSCGRCRWSAKPWWPTGKLQIACTAYQDATGDLGIGIPDAVIPIGCRHWAPKQEVKA